jgi:hypothetical protein
MLLSLLMTKNIRRVTRISLVALVSSVYFQGIFTSSPHQLLVERYLRFGRRDFGEKWSEGFDQIEEAYCVAVSISCSEVFLQQ